MNGKKEKEKDIKRIFQENNKIVFFKWWDFLISPFYILMLL